MGSLPKTEFIGFQSPIIIKRSKSEKWFKSRTILTTNRISIGVESVLSPRCYLRPNVVCTRVQPDIYTNTTIYKNIGIKRYPQIQIQLHNLRPNVVWKIDTLHVIPIQIHKDKKDSQRQIHIHNCHLTNTQTQKEMKLQKIRSRVIHAMVPPWIATSESTNNHSHPSQLYLHHPMRDMWSYPAAAAMMTSTIF